MLECFAQNRSWEDEQGNKHYNTDFVIDNCYFADKKQVSEELKSDDPF